MSIEIQNVSKNFGVMPVLKSVSLKVESGELLALLGPSGSGKTTLLRVISGIEEPDSGSIYFQGQDATRHSVKERKVGFVFQHYALFRHMNVFENIAFGLKVIPRKFRPQKDEINNRVKDLLRLIQLEKFADRYPSQLSGGQRQRVALARALAVEPKILLLDEPFGALDAMVRRELRKWLRHLHDELNITSVFVTHDQEEAFEVSDRVVIMNDGNIEQVGSPEEVYRNPRNPFVYNFIGQVNRIDGEIHRGNFISRNVEIPIKDMPAHVYSLPLFEYSTGEEESGSDKKLDKATAKKLESSQATVFVRPHDVGVLPRRHDKTDMEAVIVDRRAIGYFIQLELLLSGSQTFIEAMLPLSEDSGALRKGETVFVKFSNVKIFLGR